MSGTAVNIKKLCRLLDEFHLLTNVRISFWNAEGRHVAGNSGGNSAFCTRLRAHAQLDAACVQCDMQGIRGAREAGGLHVFCCHAGLHEYVYPVTEGGRLLGYFMIGQVNMPEVYGDVVGERRELYARCGLDEEELRALLARLPVMTHEKMLAAGHMLEALAGYVYMKGLVSIQEQPLCAKLTAYIDKNLHRPLALDDIAAELNVSRSTLCHTVRAEIGESVISLVRRMRAQRAAALLREGNSLAAAAQAAGFSTANYCARVLRKVLGVSATEIRNGGGKVGDKEDET